MKNSKNSKKQNTLNVANVESVKVESVTFSKSLVFQFFVDFLLSLLNGKILSNGESIESRKYSIVEKFCEKFSINLQKKDFSYSGFGTFQFSKIFDIQNAELTLVKKESEKFYLTLKSMKVPYQNGFLVYNETLIRYIESVNLNEENFDGKILEEKLKNSDFKKTAFRVLTNNVKIEEVIEGEKIEVEILKDSEVEKLIQESEKLTVENTLIEDIE